jgi:type VI secretion system protein ImpF
MNDQFQMTIIDRLCEGRPSTSIAEMREMVRRDLEDLLNTRQGPEEIPPWFEMLGSSLAVYGFNTIESVDMSVKDELLKLLTDVKTSIQLFEPRLENVDVSIIKDKEEKQTRSPFVLHLRIDAEMRIGDYVDRVVFNTMIQKSGATVQEASDHA